MKLLLLALLGCACAFAQTTPIYGGRTIQGGVNVFTTSGTANALIGTMPTGGTITSYASGAIYSTGALSASNTGTAGATLNIDGVGAKPIKQADGTTDIAAGTLVAGAAASFLYNGNAAAFQYLGGGGAASSSPGTIGPAVSATSPLYLYAHFRDDDPSLYMSYSYDGLNFKNMSPSAMEGQSVVRDPSVMYLNGTFYFLSTSGTNGRWVYWTSTDLINFSARQDLDITGLASSTTTWAPEWFTDPATGNVYGVGSVIIGGVAAVYRAPWTVGGGFGTATQISVTRTHPTWDLFDVQMRKVGSNYYVFFTEGPSPDHEPSQVVWASSSTFAGTYAQTVSGNPTGIPALPSPSKPSFTPIMAEGETVFQVGNTSCWRVIADVLVPYRSVFSYNSLAVDYHQETTVSCDNFATFSTPQLMQISKAEQGTVIQITDPSAATVVLNAATYWQSSASHPSNFGIGTTTPRYTVEAYERPNTAGLGWNAPVSFAATSGNGISAIWSGCGTPGTFSSSCQNPPPSNGSWMMSSDTNGSTGQVTLNNPSNSFAGMVFMDQGTQVGTATVGGTGNAWWFGENLAVFSAGTPTTGTHNFAFWDQTTNKAGLILNQNGEVHHPFGVTLGIGTSGSIDKNASIDAPASNTVDCGNGTLGTSACELRLGAIRVTEAASKATPASGTATLYINSTDHLLHKVNSAGSDAAITGGSSAIGYANVAPNSNTATTSNIVVVGDSHMSGAGQTASIPSQLTPTDAHTITNLALSGAKFCAYFADMGVHEAAVDALFNPLARVNILLMEGGLNDAIDNNTGFPAVPWITIQQVYDCQAAYARRRKALGWKILLYGAYSRTQTGIGGLTGDQLKNQLNGLYNAGEKSWADEYVDISADPNLAADGAYANTTYFQGDGIHINSAATADPVFVTTAMVNHIAAGYVQSNPTSEEWWPGKTNVFALKNPNPIFTSAVGVNLVTNTRNYFNGLTGPNGSPANSYYLYDAASGHNYFAYTLKDTLWSWGVNVRLNPTATAPACTVNTDDGNTWYDITDASNSHYKICMKTSGAVAWVTIH